MSGHDIEAGEVGGSTGHWLFRCSCGTPAKVTYFPRWAEGKAWADRQRAQHLEEVS